MSLENELKKFEIPAALKAYFTDIEVEEVAYCLTNSMVDCWHLLKNYVDDDALSELR